MNRTPLPRNGDAEPGGHRLTAVAADRRGRRAIRRIHDCAILNLTGGPEPPTFTASWSAPTRHYGQPFTAELTFSEEVTLSYRTLHDHAIGTTNAIVTGARRRGGPSGGNRNWYIDVGPTRGQVNLTLPSRSCSSQGAVCTRDNRQVEEASVWIAP